MKKHNGKTFAEWDAHIQWQYKRDWQWAVRNLGYEHISEFLVKTHQKGLTLAETAKVVGVTASAISRKYYKLGLKSGGPGGPNNRKNATGLFRVKALGFARRYFCAGRVKQVGPEFMYHTFRCTRCNTVLHDTSWITHLECVRLIRKHFVLGECEQFSYDQRMNIEDGGGSQ